MEDSIGIIGIIMYALGLLEVMIIYQAFIIFMIAAMWKLFEKANESGSSQNDNIILIIG